MLVIGRANPIVAGGLYEKPRAPERRTGKMSMFGKRGRGFTLIELLTVIAIITILASLALGGISVARKRARITGTKAELKNLSTGVDQFYDDFGYYPPSHRTPAEIAWLIKDPNPTPTPDPTSAPRPWNYVDDLGPTKDFADAVRPSSDSASPRAAVYEENGIELLVLYLSTKSKKGPYLDTDTAKLENNDNDSATSNATIFNSAFSIPDDSTPPVYTTKLYEWEDLFGQPVVYVQFQRYNGYNAGPDFDATRMNERLALSTDGPDADSDNDIDGLPVTPGVNEFRRVTPLDPRTADSYRVDSYILYSIGPNGIDNLGYSDDGNGIDDDGNGVVDDEDDITIW